MNEHELLNQQIGEEQVIHRAASCGPSSVEVARPKEDRPNLDFSQWQVGVNGLFRPGARTIDRLDPDVYAVEHDDFGPYLTRKRVLCDDVVELPDSASQRVISVMKRFWVSRERYQQHGLIYKRGILLWGPPGSGKTVTIHLLMRELIALGGIVLIAGHPELAARMLQIIRTIEPLRPLIVVMEDIDETISSFGERSILMMLDGETQIDNVVYLATTNYPERLGARIVNRPSRFDDRVLIAMPSLESRLIYLRKAATGASDESIAKWAADTDGLSIAHLRELVAAVMCLDQEYGDVLQRLRSMAERPKDIEGFASRQMGIGAAFNHTGKAMRQ